MSTYVLVITQKIWDSGLALASYLTQHLTSGAASHSSLADDASRYPAGQASLGRVLELLKSANKRELRILELGKHGTSDRLTPACVSTQL